MSPFSRPIVFNWGRLFQAVTQITDSQPWGWVYQLILPTMVAGRGEVPAYRASRLYLPLEVLPDYYLNCDSAKRLWQDWRVLRRLFIRRDHSRDLLFQGRTGWLPIHTMSMQQQVLTILTDEGETVLDIEARVIWLSRANPENTRVSRVRAGSTHGQHAWCPA